MRKLILTLIVLLAFTIAHGQTNIYHSFPDSTIWRVDYRTNNPFQHPYIVNEYFQYYIKGDTLINSLVYKKIFKSYDSVEVVLWQLPTNPPISTLPYYVGALRDDAISNKVFFVLPNATADSLLYDYNLNVGDTIKGLTADFPIVYNMMVVSVDSTIINGKYRKRWNFNHLNNDSVYIIQGIGSSAGLIEPLYSYNVDFTDRFLVCVKDSSTTVFISDYTSSAGCQLIYEGLTEVKSDDSFICYPNPFSTQTTIRTNKGFNNATLTVYNSIGQKVKQLNNISGQTISLHRNNLSKGLYFIQLIQDHKIITTTKLEIVD